MQLHVKRGEEVVVISGSHRGKRGKILQVDRAKERVIVEGVAMIKKAVKPSKENEKGGIVQREGWMHVAKLMLVSKFEARQAKRVAKTA